MLSKAQGGTIRVDKLFPLLSFPSTISHDRLFNNSVSLHHTLICLMVSSHGIYSEVCAQLRNWSRLAYFSGSHKDFMTAPLSVMLPS